MPQLQPPPYQDQQGTQRWSEWFRKINNLLSSISISIGASDDVLYTPPLGSGELLVWNDTLEVWENKTVVEVTPWLFGDGTESLPALSFALDPDTGMFRATANQLGFAAGGSQIMIILGAASHNLHMQMGSSAAPSPIVQKITGAGANSGTNLTWELAGTQPGNWDYTTTLGGVGAPNFRIKADGTNDANYLQVTPAAAAAGPTLSSQGSDTDVDINLVPKGTGVVNLNSANLQMADSDFILDENGNEYMQLVTTGGAQHYLRLRNSASATPLALTAESSIADANFTIKPKGTGYMQIANQYFSAPVVVTAASHTQVVGDRYLLCDTTSNAITVDLMAAATIGAGARLDIKCTNATNTITVDGSGSETIDGLTTQIITTLYDNMSLVCDGSNWHIL